MERQQAGNELKIKSSLLFYHLQKVWSLECFPHRLYNVNIKFSCITVLGALFLCRRLHLQLIRHLKHWYVIYINPHLYQYYNKISSGAIYI